MNLLLEVPRTGYLQSYILNLIGLSLLACLYVSNAAEKDWELVWEEEFNGEDLKNRWNFETGCMGWGNMESECYTEDQQANAPQSEGILAITARKHVADNGNGTIQTSVTSARITSKEAWQYGKFIMKARLPKGKYLWPAFWMMPNSSEWGGWPKGGEIDIMEYRGSKPNEICGTIHFGESPGAGHRLLGSGDVKFPFEFDRDWHEFGLEWNSTDMRWSVDGRSYHQQSLRENLYEGFYKKPGEPFDKPFYIILNLAVGGSFFLHEPQFMIDYADTWDKPTYEIDWIRVWQKKN